MQNRNIYNNLLEYARNIKIIYDFVKKYIQMKHNLKLLSFFYLISYKQKYFKKYSEYEVINIESEYEII